MRREFAPRCVATTGRSNGERKATFIHPTELNRTGIQTPLYTYIYLYRYMYIYIGRSLLPLSLLTSWLADLYEAEEERGSGGRRVSFMVRCCRPCGHEGGSAEEDPMGKTMPWSFHASTRPPVAFAIAADTVKPTNKRNDYIFGGMLRRWSTEGPPHHSAGRGIC